MANYLCLDQGGSSSRALVIDDIGRVLASAQLAVATAYPRADWVEQDAQAVLHSVRQVASAALAKLSCADRAQVRAAGLVTQRASCLCWHRDSGRALTPIISWQDRRAAAEFAAHPLDRRYAQRITGLMPSAHLGASKLAWCLEHDAAVRAAAADQYLQLGPLASWLTHNLVMEAPAVVDMANAARTLLCALQTRQWSAELLQAFGIAADMLPRIVATDYTFGQLSAAMTVPLRLLNGDQSSALFAYGEPRTDTAYVNLGTGAFVYVPVAKPLLHTPLQCSLCFWSENKTRETYVLEGTVHGGGAALDQWAAETGLDYRALLDGALGVGDKLPLYINGVGGLGSPDWRAQLASRYVDDAASDNSARLGAIAESILFLLQRNLQVIRAEGIALRRVIISGGLAASNALCQRLADLCELPVRRYASQEASALGAAFCLAGFPSAWLTDAAVDEFVPVRDQALHERYCRWTAAMDRAVAE